MTCESRAAMPDLWCRARRAAASRLLFDLLRVAPERCAAQADRLEHAGTPWSGRQGQAAKAEVMFDPGFPIQQPFSRTRRQGKMQVGGTDEESSLCCRSARLGPCRCTSRSGRLTARRLPAGVPGERLLPAGPQADERR